MVEKARSSPVFCLLKEERQELTILFNWHRLKYETINYMHTHHYNTYE